MTTTPEETQDLPPAPVPDQPDLPLADGYMLMPRELTAENGAKYLLSGEFSESVTLHCDHCDEEDDGCEICNGAGEYLVDVPVEWATIKDIYRKAAVHLAQPAPVAEELDTRGLFEAIVRAGNYGEVHLNTYSPQHDQYSFVATNAWYHWFKKGLASRPAVPEGWRLQLIRAYTDGYEAGHEATVEGGYVHIYQCDRDEYFAEHMEDWIKDNLAAPAKAAVLDADALTIFIRDSTTYADMSSAVLAQRICNWIAEQSNDPRTTTAMVRAANSAVPVHRRGAPQIHRRGLLL